MSPRKRGKPPLVDKLDDDAAKALGRLVQKVISDPSKRKHFQEHPLIAAEEAGLTEDEIKRVAKVINTLAGLSTDELRLLTELNETFKKEGLFVETGNPPLFVY